MLLNLQSEDLAAMCNVLLLTAPADLAAPPVQGNCPTPGCEGIGHIKGAKYVKHHRWSIHFLLLLI
jgi:Zinc finger, C2HC type